MTDLKNEECSACSNKNVYFSTEILSIDEKNGAVKKIYLFRCKEHLDTDLDEMLTLRRKKLASSYETAPQKPDAHKIDNS
ncbi:hypothetical protein [Flavobacterium sp.]|uniref:hypothetical protein n=1 Tax=Flavobacterium sp. TaxID=239 RepID=UPI00262DE361|nr:hypothetical protein [Flavobacterium sp.]